MNLQTETDKINHTDNLLKENDSLTIPVIEEVLKIDKEVIETGKVLVTKKITEEEVTFQVPTVQEEVIVEKVAVNKYVDSAPSVRYEEETMIVPVIKEVLVVEKRLMLVEELHISKRKTESSEARTEKLKKEEVTVERIENDEIISSE